MPKQPIDYSKTFVYMLCCKDPTITDVYVGHTTNLTKRKASHKTDCNNPNNKSYNLYVYQFIRENGGWENWEMIVLETKSCIDKNDARQFERDWFEKKGATLNGRRPIISKEEKCEHFREMSKIYHQEHREEHNEKMKIYHQERKDKIKEPKKLYNQEYYKNNRDNLCRKLREKRALKKLQKEEVVKISL